MSYQNPTGSAVKGSRRTGLLVFGILVLIVGVGVGLVMFLTAGSQEEDAIENLQRAPVGCDTEFEFTGTGTFVFYTETIGRIGELDGDCENTDTDYDSGDDRVRVSLTLVDDNGDEVDLNRSSGISYDAGGYVGTSIRSVEIDEPGTYTLSVESDDDGFAIAVGRNPTEAGSSQKTVGLIIAAAGLLLGLVLILLGSRRKPAAPTPNSAGGFGGFPPSQSGPFGTGSFPTQPASQPGGYSTPPYQQPGTYPQPGPYQQPGPPIAPPPPSSGGGWGAPNQ